MDTIKNALKEIMAEVPFEKINVAQICEKCNMNRKSFYYHFKDKYDLVNWIFDIEFISALNKETLETRWKTFDILCECFYENRDFYRKALKIKGQNSFSDHFRECLQPILKMRLEDITGRSLSSDFEVTFLSDALVCAIERWISEKNCMPPEQFTSLIKSTILSTAVSIYHEIETEKQDHEDSEN